MERLGAAADFTKLPSIEKVICIPTLTCTIQRHMGRISMCLNTDTHTQTYIYIHTNTYIYVYTIICCFVSSVHIFSEERVCVSLSSQCTYPSFSLIIRNPSLLLHLSVSPSLAVCLSISICVFHSVCLSLQGYWLPIINSFSLTRCRHRRQELRGGGGGGRKGEKGGRMEDMRVRGER